MVTRLLKRSTFRSWILPIFFFVISIQDAWIAQIIKIPAGAITTLIEVFCSLYIARCARKAFDGVESRFLVIPLLIAMSDLFYGFGNYVFKLPLPNQYACLTYVVPSLIAMSLLVYGFFKLTKQADSSSRRLLALAVGISLAVFSLTAVNIIYPALYQKSPVMPLLLQVLTVIYSVLESTIVGFSVALLFCANTSPLQVGLFGSLFMHLSDMAIRYQSVKLELMGFTVFEYGWCFGIILATVSAIQFLSWKRKAPIRNIETWVPLSSIRGMTIGFVMTGFVILWAGFSIYFHSIGSAIYNSSTLLILATMFAFAVIVSDFVTRQVRRAVLTIQNREEFKTGLATPFVPQEIKVIMNHFDRLTKEIAAEKDRVLLLTAGVTHDLRGPLRSLERMTRFVKDAESRDEVVKHMLTIDECIGLMKKTVNDLLRNRKEVVEGEPICEAVRKAVRVTSLAHSGSQIIVDAPDLQAGPRVHGLTRVLSNLLDNAIEASPQSAPVHLTVRRQLEHGFQISIKDHGTGIPDKVRELVEAGEPVSTKKDGNGLGLSFMVSWAKQQGVKYEIDTALGRGTEVALLIPVVET